VTGISCQPPEKKQLVKSRDNKIRGFNFDKSIFNPILSAYKMSMIILLDILHTVIISNRIVYMPFFCDFYVKI